MSTGPQLPTTFAGWAIWLIVAAAIIAILYVSAQAFGIVIPPLVMTVVWICVVAFVLVAAVKFLMRL